MDEYLYDGRPVRSSELPGLFPNTSLPAVLDASSLEALGLLLVQAVPAPRVPGAVPERDGVEQVDGVWRQRWRLRMLTAAEIAQELDFARVRLMGQATALRWEHETGGLTLPGGIRVGTASADQARITAVVANARLGGIDEVDFKAESGWVTLPVDQVLGIAGAIARHVQACFSAERRHHEAISVAAAGDLAGYDVTQGWPA